VVELTYDHKVTSKRELERITRLGLSAQIRDHRLFGVLAVSRSFGDVALKTRQNKALQEESFITKPKPGDEAKEALIATPEVTRTLIQPGDEFVIMASDGVWDVLSSQKALNFVRRRLLVHHCAQRAAGELVAEAIARGSHDNVSAIVTMLHQTG
jgi:serine/threonine protein phosphatase PrpC